MGVNGRELNTLEILDKIREIYYQNTGMVISFHSPGIKYTLDFFPKTKKSDYCSIIQSKKEGMKRCTQSDIYGLKEAKKSNDYFIYECHAGLTDVAIPLVYRGRDIGSIYTGQVLTQKPTENGFEKLYKRLSFLGIDRQSLRECYFRIKVVEREKLEYFVKLLALIGNYIITAENELFLQQKIIEKNRELHRKENEKVKLEKALKDLSISVLEFEKKATQEFEAVYGRNSRNNDIISKAQLFIKSNYSKNIRLVDVAAAVYLSPNYFSSLFKKITGFTFSQYLVQKRIDSAKKLLARSDIPIKEIVYKVGFDDYNYFNRTFKRIEGIPPAEYRKKSD